MQKHRGTIDADAEAAIRDAFSELERLISPQNVRTAPAMAIGMLKDKSQDRIYRAIEDLKNRGMLFAPSEPWKTWRLVGDQRTEELPALFREL